MAGDDHVRQRLAIGGHVCAVHDPCDIRPAMADVNADSTFLSSLVFLHLIPLSFKY
jgi:hypothetical protein